MKMVLDGHTFTHKPHPIHFSVSITVVTVLSIPSSRQAIPAAFLYVPSRETLSNYSYHNK
jgi:hypothetical protein